MNPFPSRPHMGPFNPIQKKPKNKYDAIWRDHDIGYSNLQSAWYDPRPYLLGSDVDDAAISRALKYGEWPDKIAARYFQAKRFVSPWKLKTKKSRMPKVNWRYTFHDPMYQSLPNNVSGRKRASGYLTNITAKKFKSAAKSSIKKYSGLMGRKRSYRRRKRYQPRRKRQSFKAKMMGIIYPPRVFKNDRRLLLKGDLNVHDLYELNFNAPASGSNDGTTAALNHGSLSRFKACMRALNQTVTDTGYDNEYQINWSLSKTLNSFTNCSNYEVWVTVYEWKAREFTFSTTNTPLTRINAALDNTVATPAENLPFNRSFAHTIEDMPNDAGSPTADYGKHLQVPVEYSMRDAMYEVRTGMSLLRKKTKKLAPGETLFFERVSRYGNVYGESFDSVNSIGFIKPITVKLTCPYLMNADHAGAGAPEGLVIWRVRTLDVMRVLPTTERKTYLLNNPYGADPYPAELLPNATSAAEVPNKVGNANQASN